MNDRSGARGERRRHARISPKGTVLVQALGDEQRGRIGDLSQGGVFVLTRLAPPDALLHRTLVVEMRLDTAHAGWMVATGVVVRIHSDGLALAFDEPCAELRLAIDELTTTARAHRRVMSVVLIDADEQRRSAMAAGFRATGCAVVEAATPLQAIIRLGESSFEPDIIAVADSQPPDAADAMRAFIERAHPTVKLVTIGDEILRPDGFAHWLSSANPDADLPARVRELLIAPRHRR